MPSKPKAGTGGAATAHRWGYKAWPGQSQSRATKNTCAHSFFFMSYDSPGLCVPIPFFPFFTPQHHGIAADRQFLLTLPGCLPISPARLLILFELLHLFFRVPSSPLIRSETAFVALSAPHRQIVAQRQPPVVRSGIVLFSHPVINVLSESYKRRIRIPSIAHILLSPLRH